MFRKIRPALTCGIGALLLTAASAAHAAPLTFSYDNGVDRSAQLSFEVDPTDSTQLIVKLTNTWGGDTTDLPYVLQGAYFQGADWFTNLTKEKALAPYGVLNLDPDPVNDDVGDRWAFNSNLPPESGTGGMGFASVGLGEDDFDMFSNADLFRTPSGGPGPQGLAPGPAYGIASLSTQEPDPHQEFPFVLYETVFIFSGFDDMGGAPLDANGRLTGITNVQFQYGTTLDPEPDIPLTPPLDPDPHIIPTPTAASAGLGMMLVLAFNFWFSRGRYRLTHQPEPAAV